MIFRTLLTLFLALLVSSAHAGAHKKHSGAKKPKATHSTKSARQKKLSNRTVVESAPVSLPVAPAEFVGMTEFITEMVSKYQFKQGELEQVFKGVQHRPSIIKAMDAPFTKRSWLDYRANFINPIRVSGGLKFIADNRAALQRAEEKYGIPQEIIVAIIGVETIYGRSMGTFPPLDALTTLAFDYPRRSDFFRKELVQYLLLVRERHFDLLSLRASYAGALGIPQFMPSNYRKYAVDFNENGDIDLLHDPEDAIGSVANYIKQFGWQKGEPIVVRATVSETACLGAETLAAHYPTEWATMGIRPMQSLDYDQPMRLMDFTVGEGKEFWLGLNNFAVLKRYNMSTYYAMSVYQLAEELHAARGIKN
jgi:membrane-bound lytic murein transglycosylase B